MYQIPVNYDLHPQRVCDLIVNAMEGGHTSQWMTDFVPTYPDPMPDNNGVVWYANTDLWVPAAKTEVRVRHVDLNPRDLPLPFNVFRIEQGLKLMAQNHSSYWTDFINEQDDAITADVFMQLAVLGEVVYG